MLQHVPRVDLQFEGGCARASCADLPIIVINLPHRSDRWRTLSQRMSAVGLTNLIRAPAVEGTRLSDSQIAALLRVSANGIDDAPRSHLTLTTGYRLLSIAPRGLAMGDRQQRAAGAYFRGRCRTGIAFRRG